jgi:hypothetical protein
MRSSIAVRFRDSGSDYTHRLDSLTKGGPSVHARHALLALGSGNTM